MMWNLQLSTTVLNESINIFFAGGGKTYADPFYIFSGRLRNDLYCVEWDVKL